MSYPHATHLEVAIAKHIDLLEKRRNASEEAEESASRRSPRTRKHFLTHGGRGHIPPCMKRATAAAKSGGKHPRLMTLEQSKRELLTQRLNRLTGQLEGIKKMVDEGRYCIDVLNQVSSAQEGLRSFSRIVMRNYLESCATSALRSANPHEAQHIYDEIMNQLYTHAR